MRRYRTPLPPRTCEVCGVSYGPPQGMRGLAMWSRRRYCSRVCSGKGSPNDGNSQPIEERFWTKVDRSPGHGPRGDCWRWTGAVNDDGYGSVGVDRHVVGAHRVAYQLGVGVIPEGAQVLHRCDNPACVRPDHLFLGTHADNMCDMAAKDRSTHGERSARHKLTEAEVRAIRADPRPQVRIAAELGVAPAYISQIKSRKIWRRVA